MSIIRATLIICATVLISVVAVIFTNSQQERFVVTASKDGIFIFDQKTSGTNFCTTTECKMISAEFILPKFTTIVETIPTNQQQLSPQAQNQLVNPNFGMPSSNQGQQPAAGALNPAQQPPAAAAGASNPSQQPTAGIPNQFSGNVNPAQNAATAAPMDSADQDSDDGDNSDASDESGEDTGGEGDEE